MPTVKIELAGHVDDLYTLGLLFPEGAYQDLHIVTEITGEKFGSFDRVSNVGRRETYLTGVGCVPVIDLVDMDGIYRKCCELLSPLNGYAAMADSNFRPIFPVSVSWERRGSCGGTIFAGAEPNSPTRLISANRHPLLRELLPSRVDYMFENPLAVRAANIVAGAPSWAEYYRLLEDIAGFRNVTLDKLYTVGLAEREALNAFKRAANNREFGRHGASKRDLSMPQFELMNLLEAREFVRTVVAKWLDFECGGVLPLDRVDGGALRFGLDDC